MTTLFVRHRVADYTTFKKAYDGGAAMQAQGGVLAEAVYQSVDDPNEVTVSHDFASIETARAFADNPALREAMDAAGVVGAPTIWFTTRV